MYLRQANLPAKSIPFSVMSVYRGNRREPPRIDKEAISVRRPARPITLVEAKKGLALTLGVTRRKPWKLRSAVRRRGLPAGATPLAGSGLKCRVPPLPRFSAALPRPAKGSRRRSPRPASAWHSADQRQWPRPGSGACPSRRPRAQSPRCRAGACRRSPRRRPR